MEALRVSATDIDQLRYYKLAETMEASELLARLRREDKKSPAMAAGIAFHKGLENINTQYDFSTDVLESDGYRFRFECDSTFGLPDIREVKATKDFVLDDCVVTVVGKLDTVHGNKVGDHKLTRQFDAAKYFQSYQWRIYLDLFGADLFTWNVFVGRPSLKDEKTYIITAHETLSEWRYPTMGDDVESALRDYLAFIREFMPDKLTEAV